MTKKGGDPSALPQGERGRGHSFALLRVRVTDKKKGTSKKKKGGKKVILSASEESPPFFTKQVFSLDSSFASAQESVSGH